MKTPMQELLKDLKETKITGVEALNQMNDITLRNCSISILNKTLDCIINRIETELLPKEKDINENCYIQGFCDCDNSGIMDFKKYYKSIKKQK
jgi:hypothetical protein